MSTLERARVLVRRAAERVGLLDANVSVLGKPLTPEEAIGEPGQRDFPIIIGKERILEARLLDCRGHAFTDSAREFVRDVREALDLKLTDNQSRAICVATMNAVMRHLSDAVLVTGTTLVNGTFDAILARCRDRGTRCLVFGVTGAAVCEVLGLERVCPRGH